MNNVLQKNIIELDKQQKIDKIANIYGIAAKMTKILNKSISKNKAFQKDNNE